MVSAMRNPGTPRSYAVWVVVGALVVMRSSSLAVRWKIGSRDGALMLPGGHLLSVLIFFPAVGALALLMLRGDDHKFIRIIALIVSLAEFRSRS